MSDSTGGMFRFFDAPPRDATDSQVTSALFSHQGSPSTQFTELPQEPQLAAPVLKPETPVEPKEEPPYPHLNQAHKPPPSLLPKKKRTSFKFLKRKFLQLFGRP